jgi:putative intracellular protease/amidase
MRVYLLLGGVKPRSTRIATPLFYQLGGGSLRDFANPSTVVDRNLYTGQNPASATPPADQILAALH